MIVVSLSGLHRAVLDWQRDFTWTAQRLRGKALISKILRIGWNACIYHIWKERNNRIFKQKEESPEQILEYIKVSVRFRFAGLKGVAADTVNFLCVTLRVCLIQSLLEITGYTDFDVKILIVCAEHSHFVAGFLLFGWMQIKFIQKKKNYI